METFYQKVLKVIEKYSMLSSGDKVLVAVSGGPDSVALLFALLYFQQDFALNLHIFHLNHQLRPEAEREAEFVAQLAQKVKTPFNILSYDVRRFCHENKFSLQEGAREVRYRLLKKTAREVRATKIALGHNANDLAETFLMRLLKGSGLLGLTAIPPVREGWIIRPLIEVSRADIEEFLMAHKISYLSDISNQNKKYLRTPIREKILPSFMELNPNFLVALAKTTQILREEEEYLENFAMKEYKKSAVIKEGEVSFNRKEIKSLSPVLIRRLLRLAIQEIKGDLRRIEFKHLQKVLDEMILFSMKKEQHLPGKVKVCLEEGKVVICSREEKKLTGKELKVSEEPQEIAPNLKFSLSIKERKLIDLKINHQIAYLDTEKVIWPLAVRSYNEGDWFCPLGMKGRKKLHDFFIDQKIPRRKRSLVPVVVDREKIVWIASYRLDERVKVDKSTKNVAVLKVITGE